MASGGNNKKPIPMGNKVGNWTVIGVDPNNGSRTLVRCDCGVEGSRETASLKRGGSTSCGCQRNRLLSERRKGKPCVNGKKRVDLAPGQEFNSWKLLEEVEKVNNQRHWRVRCKCGSRRVVLQKHIVSGASKSCGCDAGNKGRHMKEHSSQLTYLRKLHGKACTECGVEKSLNQYHKSSAAGDGHVSVCKDCLNKTQRRHRLGGGRKPYVSRAKPKVTVPKGTRFHMLEVLGDAPRGPDGRAWLMCICDCGETLAVRMQALKSSNTKSCGCITPRSKATNETKIRNAKARQLALLGHQAPWATRLHKAV